MRHTDTIICVANGTRARFLRCDGPGHDFDPLPTLDLHAPRPDSGKFLLGRITSCLEMEAEAFDHLMLVATPEMLDTLVAAVPTAVLVRAVEADLVGATPRELLGRVGGVF